jgi:xylose dehydrogenase (NAD/NADP)
MSEASIESCFVEYPARDWQDPDVAGTLRLAVVGLGRFARNRALPAIADSSLCEVTTLVSGSPEKAERLATEYDAEHVLSYEDFRDARAVEAYDAVYVATPNAYHAQYTEVAAAQGKHVLCEKPLATSVEEGEEMVEACEDAGVTLMTAYRLQAEPAVRRVRELVAEGVIGDPKHISGWFAYRNPDQSPSANNWRRDSSVAGGGAMIDLGVYPLNTARFILGADPVGAYATTVADTSAAAEERDRVETRATFQLAFPDGVDATGFASFDAYSDNRLQILGTEGRALIVSPFGGTVTQEVVVERGEARTSYAGSPVDEVVEEFEYFAYCVLTGTEPEPDGRDGVADLRVIRAIYESAERGERVEV